MSGAFTALLAAAHISACDTGHLEERTLLTSLPGIQAILRSAHCSHLCL